MAEITLSELDGGPQPVSGDSVWSILRHGHDMDPEKTALIAMHQSNHHLSGLVGPSSSLAECLSWTYAQLSCGAARLASFLEQNSIPPRSTVLTFVPNCAEWALMLWTAALGCHTIVPLDDRALRPGREEELRAYFEKLGPSVVMVADSGVEAVERMRGAGHKFLGISLSAHGNPSKGWTSMVDIAHLSFSDVQSKPSPVADDPNRLSTLMFTSGTSTGRSKGCPITVKNLVACTLRDWAIDRDSVGISNDDNYRSIAMIMSHRLWRSGGTVVFPDSSFSPASTLRAIKTFKATVMGVVPILTYLLFREADLYSREAVKSLKAVFVSGDVITAGMMQQTSDVFPDARIFCAWGMTEGIGALGWPEGPPDPIPTYQGVVCSGTVLPGAAIRLVDAQGRVVKRDEPGELHIRGNCMIDGYVGNASRNGFYADHRGKWFNTGDIAVLSKDGRVFVIGRSKDIIKSNGIAIAPACIEHCLSKYADIQTCVIGIPAPIYGELPYAVVEKLPQGTTPSYFARLVLEKMGRDYAIGGVLTLKQLGLMAWPRNGRNKVMKLVLKSSALERLDTESAPSASFEALAPYLSFGGLGHNDFPNSDNWESL
ncbi:AMP-dependent synthetase/ligase [Macrophomina phaseolina MS6]|uniref:AMP-dependent synthetase/ligase n=1 Tax=Macrophomina phaseolina (strain MS6) TaxID=1126212 RepID=K2RHP7_MACPH|nr:AMP-dependent synthetase/ligase [Macrophomina phaseolina MS6]